MRVARRGEESALGFKECAETVPVFAPLTMKRLSCQLVGNKGCAKRELMHSITGAWCGLGVHREPHMPYGPYKLYSRLASSSNNGQHVFFRSFSSTTENKRVVKCATHSAIRLNEIKGRGGTYLFLRSTLPDTLGTSRLSTPSRCF